MPSLTLNMNALRWNLSQMPRLEQAWNFSFMPVLKMVACHPAVVDAVKQAGYRHYGAAEVDEPLFWKNAPVPDTSALDGSPVLISLPPLYRADDVVRLFSRSPADSVEALEALDAAVERRGSDVPPHDCIVMIDLGDMREGIPIEHSDEFFHSVANRFKHLNLMGIGVTMGCLHGACPDAIAINELARARHARRPFSDGRSALSVSGDPSSGTGGRNTTENLPARPAAVWNCALRIPSCSGTTATTKRRPRAGHSGATCSNWMPRYLKLWKEICARHGFSP